MHVTAEPYWTPDFAAQVLARRAGIRYVPYSEFIDLHTALAITGWKLPRVLKLDGVTLHNDYAAFHPDQFVRLQKDRARRVLKDAIAQQDAIERELQQVQRSLEVKRAA